MKQTMRKAIAALAVMMTMTTVGTMAITASAAAYPSNSVVSLLQAKEDEGEIVGYKYTDDGRIIITKRYKMNNQSSGNFNASTDSENRFYPGALVYAGNKMNEGDAMGIGNVERELATLTISDVTMLKDKDDKYYSKSATFDPSKFSSYKEALSNLLSHVDKSKVNGMLDSNYTYATTKDDLKTTLDIDSKVIDKLHVDFTAISKGESKTYVVSYTQNYFNVHVDDMTDTKAFKDKNVGQKIIDSADADKTPAYINTAGYGRKIIVAYTSNDSSLDIKSKIEAAYQQKIEGKATAEINKTMSNITCSVYVYGGDGYSESELVATKDYNKVLDIILDKDKKCNADNAQFLSYTARHITDGTMATAKDTDVKYRTEVSCKNTVNLLFDTVGVWGRLRSFTIKYDYEFLMPADSVLAKNLQATAPDKVSDPDENGMVRIKASESKTLDETSHMNLKIPASTDFTTLKIKVGYDGVGASSNHDNFLEYNFAKCAKTVGSIEVKCDTELRWYGGYRVKAEIRANGEQVAYGNDD